MGTLMIVRIVGLTASMLATAGVVTAGPIYWTDWQGTNSGAVNGAFTATGVITTPTSTVNVTYTNPNGIGFYQATSGTDWWVPRTPAANSPYTSSVVDNVPEGVDMIALNRAGTQTLTFSEAIANPVFSFVSLNFNGYGFYNQDFEILSLGGVDGNACGYWGCGGAQRVVVDLGGGNFEYQLVANNIGGTEPHGTIRFLGAFNSLTWNSLTNEHWNGITVGVQGTAQEVFPPGPNPVPDQSSSMMLLGGSLAALFSARRRRA